MCVRLPLDACYLQLLCSTIPSAYWRFNDLFLLYFALNSWGDISQNVVVFKNAMAAWHRRDKKMTKKRNKEKKRQRNEGTRTLPSPIMMIRIIITKMNEENRYWYEWLNFSAKNIIIIRIIITIPITIIITITII